ncbi:MAG: FIST N-terminal domain-containing protein [Phycisphaerales bacterium]
MAVAPAVATAWSNHPDSSRAAQAVSEELLTTLEAAAPGQATSLAIVCLSRHHLGGSSKIGAILRRRLGLGSIIGCSAETVIGGAQEHEGVAGVSVLAARLPGVRVTTFGVHDLPLVYSAAGATQTPGTDEAFDDAELDRLASACGIDAQHRATFLLADPFTPVLTRLLPAFSLARRRLVSGAGTDPAALDSHPCPVVGGIASASSRPAGNVLILGDRVLNAGLVGLSLSGAIRVDPVVSQGCKAFGQPLIVTAAHGNVIRTLGRRSALEALNAAIEHLNERDRAKLSKGVFLGRVVNEYQDRFGRGDFLIRGVMGVSRESGEIAINDAIRVGQTVQFHLRDARSATEDLELALDAQRLHAPPIGALLITCNGRGQRMFDEAHHDARAVARLFELHTPAETLAKSGTPIAAEMRAPIAGFHASGEIGPVGESAFVHGFTACAAVFRPPIEPA